MSELQKYNDAVNVIKTAILQSQYEAAKSVNEKQLMLYFAVGKYISINSRKGFWGKGAIDSISEQLNKELPGLRGFTSRNLRYMRTFYEEWEILDSTRTSMASEEESISNLELASSKIEEVQNNRFWDLQMPNIKDFPLEAFLHIGFTHHRIILGKVKDLSERLFYIERCAKEQYSIESLNKNIANDDFHHQGNLPNNFVKSLSASQRALKAINVFKDEYLLDYINVEKLEVRDKQDVDEKLVENAIIHNIKNFILTFGKGFAFIRNQ